MFSRSNFLTVVLPVSWYVEMRQKSKAKLPEVVIFPKLSNTYSLPMHVVNSSSVNSFKNNLDKFWSNQEVYYNFKCEITGTGNRSVSELIRRSFVV